MDGNYSEGENWKKKKKWGGEKDKFNEDVEFYY